MSRLDDRGVAELRATAELRPVSRLPEWDRDDWHGSVVECPAGWDLGRFLDVARQGAGSDGERGAALAFAVWRQQQATVLAHNRGRLQAVLVALVRYRRALDGGQELGDLGARLAHAAAEWGVRHVPADTLSAREAASTWAKENGQ